MKAITSLRTTLPLALAALIVALVLGASAGAAPKSELEGVWSFNGGNIAIQRLSNGTFQGTVVTTTKFASCAHPVGQVLWTDMSEQPGGSFAGFHAWFHGSECATVPVLGQTAWRVLHNSTGERFLRVCFSYPNSGSQPTISSSGAVAGDTYGCANSALIAPLPTLSGSSHGSGNVSAAKDIILPKLKGCARRTSLEIKVREPKYDPIKEVVVEINHKKVLERHLAKISKSSTKTILLKHLPSGTFKVTVIVITVLKQRFSLSRTYHPQSCKVSHKTKHRAHGKRKHKG